MEKELIDEIKDLLTRHKEIKNIVAYTDWELNYVVKYTYDNEEYVVRIDLLN